MVQLVGGTRSIGGKVVVLTDDIMVSLFEALWCETHCCFRVAEAVKAGHFPSRGENILRERVCIGCKLSVLQTSSIMMGGQTANSSDSWTPKYEKKKVVVLGKRMAYYEVPSLGSGAAAAAAAAVEEPGLGGYDPRVGFDRQEASTTEHTIVFVHGNPTCSYMWRNVMPHCEGLAGTRLVAVDLIGMGDSDKLLGDAETADSEKKKYSLQDVDRYSLKVQSRYFSAFLDAIGVVSNVTFVAHSWGGTLAAYWGSQNPGAVKGLVSLEVVYVPFASWDHVPEKIRGGVKLMLRQPFCKNCCCSGFDLGAHLILKKNLMLEKMPDRVNGEAFGEKEMIHYRQPFPDPASRLPILAFVRSIPVAGKPAHVVEMMDAGRKWIERGSRGFDEVKVLFLCVEPGTMTEDDRNCIRSWNNVTEVTVHGGHMATEDCPHDIGMAIAKWFREEIRESGRLGSERQGALGTLS